MSHVTWFVEDPIEYEETDIDGACLERFAECRIIIDADGEVVVRHNNGKLAALDLAMRVAARNQKHPDWIVRPPRKRQSYRLVPPVGPHNVGECQVHISCDSELTITHRGGLVNALALAKRIVNPWHSIHGDR